VCGGVTEAGHCEDVHAAEEFASDDRLAVRADAAVRDPLFRRKRTHHVAVLNVPQLKRWGVPDGGNFKAAIQSDAPARFDVAVSLERGKFLTSLQVLESASVVFLD